MQDDDIIDFRPDLLKIDDELIIYGASVYGEIAYRLLESENIRPDFYCDRDAKSGDFLGVRIIRPEELNAHKNAWVMIASADYYHEIRSFLIDNKVEKICNMSYLLENCEIDTSILSLRAQDIYKNRNNYIDVANQSQSGNSLNFTRLQFVVSERCSLKCRDCTHLMQYYRDPKNVDLAKYREAFDRIVRISDNISEVRILGGEPFMNPDVYRIIEWWQDFDKIGIFTIYTNGTIVPTRECLAVLRSKKCRVRISDYGHNRERIDKVAEVLKASNIEYYVNRYDHWADAGDLRKRGRSKAENVRLFAGCYERNCITFFHGKLHRCPRSAHAMRLGAVPDTPVDYVDVAGWVGTDKELKKVIKNLQSRNVITTCDYCDGPSTKELNIPAAVQVKKPLDFVNRLFYENKKNEVEL